MLPRGRGGIPGRDDDIFGVGYFYNDVQTDRVPTLIGARRGTAIGASRPSTTSSSHQATEKTVDGSKYYVSGDAYYQQVSTGGKNIYMVVADPTKSV